LHQAFERLAKTGLVFGDTKTIPVGMQPAGLRTRLQLACPENFAIAA